MQICKRHSSAQGSCQCCRYRHRWPWRRRSSTEAFHRPLPQDGPNDVHARDQQCLLAGGNSPAAGSRPAADPPARRDSAAPSSSFAECHTASTRLRQRWGLLQGEQRLEQLAWEARQVRSREPDWPVAASALCVALIGLRHYDEAAGVAARGCELWPHDRSWQELRDRAEVLRGSERSEQRGAARQPQTPLRMPRAQVVVASVFCGEDFQRKMRPACENHARWCALQGYTYACLEENLAGREDPTWSKILHVLQLFEKGAEYVFWMDADSLFIHDGVDLQWACDLDRDFVFSGDLNVVFNAGHFLARRSSWTRKFLSDAFRIYPWPHWEDNGAMMIMLGGGSPDDRSTWFPCFERLKVATQTEEECRRAMRELLPPAVAAHVAAVPQHRLNAYEWPGGGGRAALVRGDPILHFAGCSADEKTGLVARFARCTGDPACLTQIFG